MANVSGKLLLLFPCMTKMKLFNILSRHSLIEGSWFMGWHNMQDLS